MSEVTISVIKVFVVGFLSFLFAFSLTPTLTHFLYKHKLWKKESKHESIDGKNVKYFQKFHAEEELKTPRVGGLLIWVSVTFLIFFLFLLSKIFDLYWIKKLDFLSREQTWLPLFTLVAASLVGLLDDLLQVLDCFKNKFLKKGLSLRYRLLLVSLIGFIGGWWFYFRLGQDFISIPFFGEIHLGVLYIPFFIITMIAIYSGGIIDGIDGLSGGTFASIFTAYTAIALFQGQINLATFCLAIVGSILAFLWFNIPPARFYMGETGVIGLTATLTVVAFLTNAVAVLPIIAFLLVVTSASVIIQLLSKKIFNKKVFLAAPLHHHFEAAHWPHYKVTMRFWIVGVVVAIMGVVIHLLG
jgi:phospho-N-acetylmuramoyl-pentapeptide-transferase